MTASLSEAPRELARRAGAGIDVTLYWDASDDSTSVEVCHHSSGVTLAFSVAREYALDAFYHPFAHLPTGCEDAPELERGDW
jgi:hypothetical protein